MNAGCAGKLWNPLRTHAIPERLRGVFTTRRYTNPSLSYLTLPYQLLVIWQRVFFKLVVRESTLVLHIYNNSASQRKMSQVVCDYGLRRINLMYCIQVSKRQTLLIVQQSFAYYELTVRTRSVFLLLLTVWHGITRAWTHLNQSCIHFIFQTVRTQLAPLWHLDPILAPC